MRLRVLRQGWTGHWLAAASWKSVEPLSVAGFVDGYEAALEGFKAEKNVGNSGMTTALACLEADFCHPDRDGPARAAAFHPGGAQERERVRQDMVTVGRALLGT